MLYQAGLIGLCILVLMLFVAFIVAPIVFALDARATPKEDMWQMNYDGGDLK